MYQTSQGQLSPVVNYYLIRYWDSFGRFRSPKWSTQTASRLKVEPSRLFNRATIINTRLLLNKSVFNCYYVFNLLYVTCHVMSRHVTSRHIMSRHVTPRNVTSRHVMLLCFSIVPFWRTHAYHMHVAVLHIDNFWQKILDQTTEYNLLSID